MDTSLFVFTLCYLILDFYWMCSVTDILTVKTSETLVVWENMTNQECNGSLTAWSSVYLTSEARSCPINVTLAFSNLAPCCVLNCVQIKSVCTSMRHTTEVHILFAFPPAVATTRGLLTKPQSRILLNRNIFDGYTPDCFHLYPSVSSHRLTPEQILEQGSGPVPREGVSSIFISPLSGVAIATSSINCSITCNTSNKHMYN